ncbi:hypothetical protein [Streptomyces sp. H27-D2]|nr:hypothetical protein [Streptomyces sp. H27-D2]MEC4017248.1 hypothetical protein [Streptomyces sp. H27-D2]
MAFTSYASNLAAGDANGEPDVFVRNLRTGKLQRIAVEGGSADHPR